MNVSFWTIVVGLVVTLAVIGGGIGVQIFLSGRESRWAGLVLPLVALLFSIIAALSVVRIGTFAETVLMVAYVFVLYNIPTAILLAIYAACRGKRKRRKALDKMLSQDLE